MILLHDMVNRQNAIIIIADVLLHSHSVQYYDSYRGGEACSKILHDT